MALLNSFWKRHRRLLFILGLFAAPFLPLLLLRVDMPRFHFYDRFQAWIVHPIAELAGNTSGGAGVLWSRYIALVHATEENDQLKKKIGELDHRILELEESGRENERLRKVLAMPDLVKRNGTVAKIIGQDANHESLRFVINAGSKQGIELRMPVVHSEGIVGTIVRVYRNSAVFLSFLDPSHDVDGLIVRSRARLVVEGKGRHLLGRLKYLDRSEDVRVGDEVVTSGIDGVFPKGWPIGNIVKIDKPDAGVTQEAELRASVDPGKLEEVVILRSPPDPESEEVTTAQQLGPQQATGSR